MVAICTISAGKLKLSSEKRFKADLANLKDGQYELLLRRKNRRSEPQNRYLWGVVYQEIRIRLKELGNDFTSEEIHELMKLKFNPVPLVLSGGEIEQIGGSTAKMNKEEMSIYLDKIFLWCAEFLEIDIPSPGAELNLFD
jgi:hypothetical protein